jgi:two-component system phosphate regulon sensor histidine kinase PhoR
VRGDDDRVVAAVVTYEDVTGQHRREQADRDFVSNAAHQLRTPLTAIASAVAVLQGGAKEIPEERDRFLGHLERETDRLARLGHALLALARAQREEEQPALAIVPLHPLLKAVVDEARPKDGVAITLDCPPELAATTNAELLEEALGNIVANAVSYTEAGRIDVVATRADGAVRIDISDTGPGISEDARGRAFDRFFRGDAGRRGGFGLGLPIARAAIEAAGGEIELESTSRGTTARIVLRGAALLQ